MFSKRDRYVGEILTRRSVCMHMARGAESMVGDGAEVAEFGAMLARTLGVRDKIAAHARPLVPVGARPAVTTVSAHHGGGHSSVDRHPGEANG